MARFRTPSRRLMSTFNDSVDFVHRKNVWEFPFGTRASMSWMGSVSIFPSMEVLAKTSYATQHSGLAVSCQATVKEVAQESLDVRELDVHGRYCVFFAFRELLNCRMSALANSCCSARFEVR